MAHGNVVSAAPERVGFDEFDAANIGRLELDLQFVLAVFQAAFARDRSHQRFVGGQCRAATAGDQPGLRNINPVGAFVEQDKTVVFIGRVLELVERGLDQRAAFGVKHQCENVSRHHQPLLDRLGRRRRCATGHGRRACCACRYRRGNRRRAADRHGRGC